MFSQEQLVQIFDAISFSAEKHKTQKRYYEALSRLG
jgi:hypothetical protein